MPNLLISQFASPPLRTLLLLLSTGRAVPSTKGSAQDDKRLRSKKSAKFRVNQAGQMQSVVRNENEDPSTVGQGKKSERIVPVELQDLRRRIMQYLLKRLSPVEWRAMGVENVGGPTIQVCTRPNAVHAIPDISFSHQVLLECEHDEGNSNQAGSILDNLTSGLVGQQGKDRA
jgi:nucleolar protein 9